MADPRCRQCGGEATIFKSPVTGKPYKYKPNSKGWCQFCFEIAERRRVQGGHHGSGNRRTADHKQAYGEEVGPWGENAIRALEDG